MEAVTDSTADIGHLVGRIVLDSLSIQHVVICQEGEYSAIIGGPGEEHQRLGSLKCGCTSRPLHGHYSHQCLQRCWSDAFVGVVAGSSGLQTVW